MNTATKDDWINAYGINFKKPKRNKRRRPNSIIEEPKPPKVSVESLTSRGMATVKFSKSMFRIDNIAETSIKVANSPQRRLQDSAETSSPDIMEEAFVRDYIEQKIFDVELLPGINSYLN